MFLLRKMNQRGPTTRLQLWTGFLRLAGAEPKPPTFGLATKRFRAVDLSCRACGAGAGCWAWIPGWGNLRFCTPNLRLQDCPTARGGGGRAAGCRQACLVASRARFEPVLRYLVTLSALDFEGLPKLHQTNETRPHVHEHLFAFTVHGTCSDLHTV